MRIAIAAGLGLAWILCAPAQANECPHDREAMLALGFEAFDQDRAGGWRPLADIPGCEGAAADLIAAYRAAHASDVPEQNQRSLRWHEAQLRAAAGQTAASLPLFESTRRADDNVHFRADDLYLDATLAFLRRDRPALEAARAELASLPQPDGFAAAVQRARERYGDEFADSITWPSNLDVVDGFLTCFDRPYAEAYARTCRTLPAAP